MREEFVIMVFFSKSSFFTSSAVHQYSGLLCGRFLDSQRQSTPTSTFRPTLSTVFSLCLLGHFYARRGHSGTYPHKKNFSILPWIFSKSRKLEVLSMQRCCPLYSRLKSSTTGKPNFTGIPTFHGNQDSTVVQKSVEKFHTVFQWNSVFPK